MSGLTADNNARPAFDKELTRITDYVIDYEVTSQEALDTAIYCLMDSLGCAMLALRYPECTKLLGPIVPGTSVLHGARVPGTPYELDPVQAAFNLGTMIRWLDFNDTWLAAEWGHPSDNLGGILAVADYLSRVRISHGEKPLTIQNVLEALIKAYEIQGILALENSFNKVGLDHVVLVKVASTAVISEMLGSSREQILNALSLAWVDGQSMRTYRHAPNTGSRKSWAAGDATSRAVRLSLMAKKDEMGYPSVLSAQNWGFYDVLFKGQPFKQTRPYASYVMENILFKLAFPAEFHAQTAVECAVALHPKIAERINNIERIVLTTQESAVRIINKVGPLHNPADRDHSLQYMVAIGLLFGKLTADHYEDEIAKDPRIDHLRQKMEVIEDPEFSQDYLDPNKRSIANSIQIYFNDGTCTEKMTTEYPIGHRRRRAEGIPVLVEKFKNNLATRFPKLQTERILYHCLEKDSLLSTPVNVFMDYFLL